MPVKSGPATKKECWIGSSAETEIPSRQQLATTSRRGRSVMMMGNLGREWSGGRWQNQSAESALRTIVTQPRQSLDRAGKFAVTFANSIQSMPLNPSASRLPTQLRSTSAQGALNGSSHLGQRVDRPSRCPLVLNRLPHFGQVTR